MQDMQHAPKRPGEILQKTVLDQMDITQERLAKALGVSRHTANLVINGRRSVTPEMALRLAHVLGTSAEMWLNIQARFDLYEAGLKIGDELRQLPRLREPRVFDEGTLE